MTDIARVRSWALPVLLLVLTCAVPASVEAQTRDGGRGRDRPGGCLSERGGCRGDGARDAGKAGPPRPGGYRCYNIVGRPYRSSRPCGIS